MKKILIMVLALVFLLTPVIYGSEEKPLKAIGFAGGGTGGSGLSYKHFFSPEEALQITGGISGDPTFLGYGVGLMYQQIPHETDRARLIFAPGVSFWQNLDLNEDDDIYVWEDSETGEKLYYNESLDAHGLAAGAAFGIELKFDQVGLGFFTGYRAYTRTESFYESFSTREEAENYTPESEFGVGLTGDISLFYYF